MVRAECSLANGKQFGELFPRCSRLPSLGEAPGKVVTGAQSRWIVGPDDLFKHGQQHAELARRRRRVASRECPQRIVIPRNQRTLVLCALNAARQRQQLRIHVSRADGVAGPASPMGQVTQCQKYGGILAAPRLPFGGQEVIKKVTGHAKASIVTQVSRYFSSYAAFSRKNRLGVR